MWSVIVGRTELLEQRPQRRGLVPGVIGAPRLERADEALGSGDPELIAAMQVPQFVDRDAAGSERRRYRAMCV